MQDKVAGGSLHQYLRHQGKKYRKRYDKNDYRGHIPNRVDIDDRPSIVDSRSRIGDWEADCVIGKGHQGVFATLAERESRLYLALQTKNKTAQVFAPEKPAYSTSLYIKRNQRGYTQVVRAYETTCDDTNHLITAGNFVGIVSLPNDSSVKLTLLNRITLGNAA